MTVPNPDDSGSVNRSDPDDQVNDDERALDWARTRLGGRLEVELIKARPWATTWRLRSAGETVVYLKRSSASTSHEGPLMATLAKLAPDAVPPVLASVPDKGWFLLGDAGQLLCEHGSGFDLGIWTAMLVRFAELQRAVEPAVARLLADGVPDERPLRYTHLLHSLLSTLTERARGASGGIVPPPGAPRSAALAEWIARWERAWAGQDGGSGWLGLPATIQHGDLHDGNVGVTSTGVTSSRTGNSGRGSGTGSGSTSGSGSAATTRRLTGIGAENVRFFDFGDASIAHPFVTMHVPLEVARLRGASLRDLDQLRDAYLGVFVDHGTPAQLRHEFDRILGTAALLRASAWQRALEGATAKDVEDWGDPVFHWLGRLVGLGSPA